MQWQVKYNPRGETWELKFPPAFMNVETEEFSSSDFMSDVLIEAMVSLVGMCVLAETWPEIAARQ
jgi:hypothetical protein